MSRRLLLAEDDPNVREALTKLFTRQGWIVLAVASGDDAITAYDVDSAAICEAAQRRCSYDPFDAVLTDFDMGFSQNGLAVARHIARNPRCPKMPVVLFTGANPMFSPEDAALFARIRTKGGDLARLVDLMDHLVDQCRPK